jgi:hypothetical protein
MYQSSLHQVLEKITHVLLDHIAVLGPVSINEMCDDFLNLIGAGTVLHNRFGGITQFQPTLRIEKQASAGPSVGPDDHRGVESGPDR